MSASLVTAPRRGNRKVTSGVTINPGINPGQVWKLSPAFLAERSTLDRIVVPGLPGQRIAPPADCAFSVVRTAPGCNGPGSVVMQPSEGSGQAPAPLLFIRTDELLEHGTFSAGLYRVLSASGKVLGNFDNQGLALAAMSHWDQAVAVVCGANVVAEKGKPGRTVA